MGVPKFISSTTEFVKGKAPDLTLLKNVCNISYGYISSAFCKIRCSIKFNGLRKPDQCKSDEEGQEEITLVTETVKTNTSDLILTPKDACKASCDCVAAFFRKIHDAVRFDGLQKLNQCMSDERVAWICCIISKLAQNVADFALEDFFRRHPGVRPLKIIVVKTYRDVKSENGKNEEMKATKETIGTKSGKFSDSRDVIDPAEIMHSESAQFGDEKEFSADSIGANRTPEDVFRILSLVTKAFIGTCFLPTLMIPLKKLWLSK